MGLSRRLPEIDRSGPIDEVTSWFQPTFLLSRGLSPAVSGEESTGKEAGR
jgi:hypothetical protein